MLEGRGHAIDFLTGDSAAFRLGHVDTTVPTSAAISRALVGEISKSR